jgi:hypothetical protein
MWHADDDDEGAGWDKGDDGSASLSVNEKSSMER